MNRDLTKEERDELAISNRMTEMMATEGWKFYAKLLQTHIDMKIAAALSPSKSVDEALASNADKGAILGIRLALSLPSGIVNAANDLRAQVGGEIEEE